MTLRLDSLIPVPGTTKPKFERNPKPRDLNNARKDKSRARGYSRLQRRGRHGER